MERLQYEVSVEHHGGHTWAWSIVRDGTTIASGRAAGSMPAAEQVSTALSSAVVLDARGIIDMAELPR